MNYYQKQYEELVYFRQHVEILTDKSGTELHHIKMKKLYPQLIKEPTNLVRLTIYEHILAHKYLKDWYTEEFGLNDYKTQIAILAYDFMIKTRDGITLTDEEAAQLRAERSLIQSVLNTERWKDPQFKQNWKDKMKIIQSSQSYKQHMSEVQTIRQADKTYRKNMSKSVKEYWNNNDSARQEQSIRSKKLWKNDKHRKHISKTSSNNWKNPNYRQTIINARLDCIKLYNEKLQQEKYINVSEVKTYLDNGWTRGKIFYHMSSRGKTKYNIDIIFVCSWKCKNSKPTAGGVKWYSSLEELSLKYHISLEECERRRIEAMKKKGLI